jgi:capsular exopolysaccharide synthesis family protein
MTRSNALTASQRLTPAPVAAAPLPTAAMPQEPWGAPPPPTAGQTPIWQRYLAAVGRFKWLVLAMTLLGLTAGYIATRYIKPEYDIYGKITLRDPSAEVLGNSRERSNESWLQLFRAFYITDSVTRSLRLYLEPKREADSVYFREFSLAPVFYPGTYELTTDAGKANYVLRLTRKGDSREVERGRLGDSIGRTTGLRWAPKREQLPARATIEFEVMTPREASIELQKKLRADAPPNTDVMNVSLRGEDPIKTEIALNQWMKMFVALADEIKNGGVSQNANAIRASLEAASAQLNSDRRALEEFRVDAITKPTDQAVLAPGLGMTQAPVLDQYTRTRTEAQIIRNDREFLEGMLRPGRLQDVDLGIVMSLASLNGGTGEQLRGAFTQLYTIRGSYNAKRALYTDSAPDVLPLRAQLERLENQVIPSLLRQQIASLKLREEDLAGRVRRQSSELREIPTRTLREEELRTKVAMQGGIVQQLSENLEKARLAEQSRRNDVFVQDSAVAPLKPTSNTALQIIPAGIVLGLGLGLALAILLDILDKRVRYPDQVTKELDLDIIGAIPLVHPGRPSVEEQAQLVESFRTLRLSLRHQFAAGEPVSFTVTSTGPSEGKSFVASNLALSFAEAGFRTCLVDGDTRRGAIQQAFGVPQKPGLVDFLLGTASLDDIVYPTSYDRLALVPCGTRHRQAPEMVTTAAMESLLDELRARYDVVICDSPPLGAGTDGYALSTLTGGLLMVLRVGMTDRKLAVAKLQTMDRLPIRPLGAVLNGIEPKGIFQYYHYLEGYTSSNSPDDDGEPSAPLPRKGKGSKFLGGGKAASA